MNDSKPWYTSKTVIASLVAVGSMLLAAFGYHLDDGAQVALTEALLQVIAVAASLFAIIGRVAATKRIG